jgi:hypothetical protein
MTTKINLPEERRFKRFVGPKFEKVYDPNANDFVITGYFTSDNVDKVGDIITKDATRAAIGAFKEFPTLRLMHQPIPCGKVISIGEPDGLEWNQLSARIVSDDVKKLVAEDVLTAMSVGIIVKEFEPVDPNSAKADPFWFMSGSLKITSYDLVEISLVDSPACPDARITDHPGMVSAQQQKTAVLFKAMPTDIELAKKEGSSEVQSLVLSKEKFKTKEEANKWITDHDFKIKEGAPDEKENTWRYRQFDPAECEKDSFGTKDMTEGVQAVYCVKKSKGSSPTTTKDTEKQGNEVPVLEKSHSELPDQAFAFCESTGEKTDDGKTKPLSARHLPHHTKEVTDGSKDDHLDLPLLRAAYSRENQVEAVTDTISTEDLRKKCHNHLEKHHSALDDGKMLGDDTVWQKFLDTKVEQTVAEWNKFVEKEKMDEKLEKEKKPEAASLPPDNGALNDPDGKVKDWVDSLAEHKKALEDHRGALDAHQKVLEAHTQKMADLMDALDKKPADEEETAEENPIEEAQEQQKPTQEVPKPGEDLPGGHKAEIAETVKAETAQDGLTKEALLTDLKTLLVEERKNIVAEVQMWTKTYIDELRKPQPGKAAVISPKNESKTEETVEPISDADLKKMTPEQRTAHLRKMIRAARET